LDQSAVTYTDATPIQTRSRKPTTAFPSLVYQQQVVKLWFGSADTFEMVSIV